jgi:hypothetical protein
MTPLGWLICFCAVICGIAAVLLMRARAPTNTVHVPSDFGEEGEQ